MEVVGCDMADMGLPEAMAADIMGFGVGERADN